MTETAWPPVAAMCAAGARDEALHARCHAHGCECPCHAPAPAPAEPTRCVRSVTVPVSCSSCGSELHLIAGSAPNEMRQAVILGCESCGAELHLVVTAGQTKRGSTPATRQQLQAARPVGPTGTKLTAEDIADARSRRSATGESFAALGAHYGVSGETMRRALTSSEAAA